MNDNKNLRIYACYAGFGLLLMTLTAIFSEFNVFQKLIIQGEVSITFQNITENQNLFRLGVFGFIVIIVLDLLVAWALYIFLKGVDKNLSLLTAWCRLIYTTIFAAALMNYFDIMQIVENTNFISVFSADQLQLQLMSSINSFRDGWSFAYIFFGLHLLLLGLLVIRSQFITKIIGYILLISGIGYLVEYLLKFLSPELNFPMSSYTGWGELIIMIWLIVFCLKRR